MEEWECMMSRAGQGLEEENEGKLLQNTREVKNNEEKKFAGTVI
jgi:hypothetical protein